MKNKKTKPLLSSIQKYSPNQTAQAGSLKNSFIREQRYILKHTWDSTGQYPNLETILETAPNKDYPFRFVKKTPVSNPPESFEALPTIQLYSEKRPQKIAKELSLVSEIQIGIPEFDDKIFINTKAPEFFVRSILSSPQLQENVLSLLQANWTSITLYSVHSPIQLHHNRGTPPEGNVDQYLDNIEAIYKELPEIKTKQKYAPMGFNAWLNIAISICFIPLLFFILETDNPLAILDPGFLKISITSHLFLILLSTIVLFELQRGNSQSLKNFFFSIILVYTYIFMGTTRALHYININFTAAEQQTVVVSVTKKRLYKDSDSGRISHYLSLSESPQTSAVEIDISKEMYEKATLDQKIKLYYREGALGYTWLEDFSIQPLE